MDHRQLTPSGLPLYTEKEFTELARLKNVPTELAVISSYISEVESFDSKAAAKDQNRFKFRISTDAVDRDKDVISIAGWDLAEYKKNPVVLYAHDYHSLPVGKSLDIAISKRGLDADVEFVPGSIYPFAETVRGMVQGGYLRAASVGFKPMKYMYNEERRGVDIEESKLLEWSIVPVPANAECLVQLSLMPKGLVDEYAKACESYLEACKGKGQWVVGIDLSKLATKEDITITLDGKAIAKSVIDHLPAALQLRVIPDEHKAMAGCSLKDKCPNPPEGHPDTCPKGKACPMIAANHDGGMRSLAELDDVLEGIELPMTHDSEKELILEDEHEHVLIGRDIHEVDKTVRDLVREMLKGSVREQVIKQINYARGRVD